ncbi:Aste57867_18217 [Aphanomyces stellatus]|uniref:Aste57867_18217 protein n=1 Tax=Aphanomyces stellatus TaxID=120398 RepID=A0A485LD84_9STRA|nr:hypothetical protein As57867_018155 [Aphanomyces stellatus]VFT94955.1 Aste57867_18217 [Aphanomyces stellatus]
MSYEHVDPQQHLGLPYGGYTQHYDTLGMEIPYEQHPASSSQQQQSHHHATQQQHHHLHQPFGYAPTPPSGSLKRKSPMYQDQHQPPPTQYAFAQAAASMANDQNNSSANHTSLLPTSPHGGDPASVCDICKYPDPILYVPDCGHTFHSRCVGEWPMAHCPYCQGDVPKVAVVQIDMTTKTTQRSGKWTKQEEKFVNLIVDEFDHGTFPLANGTPVRLVLAKLLNCSPMRLSKKFQKNALGKRTYRVPKNSGAAANGSRISFDTATHQARQIEFSAVESAFRQEVVVLQRKDSKQDGYIELRDLRLAVIQFWVANFLKFALSVGQQVEGLDTTEPKKKKQAMQKLRDGMFDQVFSWAEKRPASPPMHHHAPPPSHHTMQASSHHPQQPSQHQTLPPQMTQQWETPYFKAEPFKTTTAYDDENVSDDRDLHHLKSEIPFQPSNSGGMQPFRDFGGYHQQQYKRPHTSREPTGRMALTPLPMRAGMRPDVLDDQSTSPELDGLLMGGNTPSNAPFRAHTQQHAPPSYDAMDPIPQLPANPSWDQMLDDFTGINSHLVDPALSSWSNIQLS